MRNLIISSLRPLDHSFCSRLVSRRLHGRCGSRCSRTGCWLPVFRQLRHSHLKEQLFHVPVSVRKVREFIIRWWMKQTNSRLHDRGGTDGAALWKPVKRYFQPRPVHQVPTASRRHCGSVPIVVAQTSPEVRVSGRPVQRAGAWPVRRQLHQRPYPWTVATGTGWSNAWKSGTSGSDVGAGSAGSFCSRRRRVGNLHQPSETVSPSVDTIVDAMR